jgi:putative nucleotidyltransferase with HDIG domain
MKTEDHGRINGIIAFANAIMVLRDPYEDGHEMRVALLAAGLANKLNLPKEFVEHVEYGAHLHDVGKIMIAESILNKTKLSASERSMINSHASLGAKAISALHFGKVIEDAIHHHHENWDGSGYPDGLQREAIPMAARIIRVVDCFDAMTHKRLNHITYSLKQAIAEMDKENGTSFDPTIFNVFKMMMLNNQ